MKPNLNGWIPPQKKNATLENKMSFPKPNFGWYLNDRFLRKTKSIPMDILKSKVVPE